MKNKAAQAMARLRMKKLSPERRREIASKAGKAGGRGRPKGYVRRGVGPGSDTLQGGGIQ